MNDMRKLMEAIDKAENVEEGFRHAEDSIGEQIKSLLAQGKKIMSRLAGASGEIIDIEFSGPFQFAKLQDRDGVSNIRVDADPRLELIGTIEHYALVRKVDENMSTYKDYLKEGYFSRLDAALDELVANNPNLSADKLVAIARSKYGQEAATFLSDKLEAETDLADFNASDPQPHLREYEEEKSYDEFVEYYVGDLSRSIVRKGVFKDLYTAAGEDIDVLNAAIKDEAYSIADSYYGTGDGIGTSDMNHFIQGIGKQLGIDDLFGWHKPKIKSDDEMERDKTNRYAKYNTAIRGKEGLGEDDEARMLELAGIPVEEAQGKKVTVPVELSDPDPKNPKATSADAEAFLHALGPDDEVDDYVVDPETGEVLFEPFMTKRGEGMDKFKSAREYHDQKETWVPSMYGADNQDDAWEELGDLRHGNNNAARFYNIVWRNLGDLLGDPRDLGTDAEDWGELDYDTGYDVPVVIKRKDGKKMQEEDYDNFRTLASLVKHATGNISLSMMGTTEKGTVARFTPTLM